MMIVAGVESNNWNEKIIKFILNHNLVAGTLHQYASAQAYIAVLSDKLKLYNWLKFRLFDMLLLSVKVALAADLAHLINSILRNLLIHRCTVNWKPRIALVTQFSAIVIDVVLYLWIFKHSNIKLKLYLINQDVLLDGDLLRLCWMVSFIICSEFWLILVQLLFD